MDKVSELESKYEEEVLYVTDRLMSKAYGLEGVFSLDSRYGCRHQFVYCEG